MLKYVTLAACAFALSAVIADQVAFAQQGYQDSAMRDSTQQNVMVENIVIEEIPTPSSSPDIIDQPDADTTQYEDGSSPLPTFEPMKYAILQTLDKVTARTQTVTLPIGKASAVGPIFAEVKTCQKTPPTEQPEAAAFLQVWEAKPKAEQTGQETESQWVFSGWMFASSPALSAMDHPIYDVWLKDCTNEITPQKSK